MDLKAYTDHFMTYSQFETGNRGIRGLCGSLMLIDLPVLNPDWQRVKNRFNKTFDV